MIPIKRKTNQLTQESRRSHTFEYYLKSNETDILPVCKKMFLETLGLKENMVQNWIKNTLNGLPKNYEFNKNNRSSSHLVHKSSLESRQNYITDWFNSLPKMQSHYCRKQTSRLYLEGPFKNTQEIYNVYKSKSTCDGLLPLSKTFFHQFMKEKRYLYTIQEKIYAIYVILMKQEISQKKTMHFTNLGKKNNDKKAREKKVVKSKV